MGDNMKKNKKIIIIIIGLICLLIVGVILYLFVFKGTKNYYTEEKILRFYEWNENQYIEYKYKCNKDNCCAKEISNKVYLLTDDNKYLFNPVENSKNKVNFDGNDIYEVINDNDDKPFALVFSESEDYDSNKTLYVVKDNKTYFKDKQYIEVDFITYEEVNGEKSKEKIVNFDYVVAKSQDGNIYVIDYKKSKTIFDSTKLNFKAEEDEKSLSFKTVKISDNKYYYIVECPEGISYLLNDKFEKITSYSSKGLMGQFGEGDQYLIYNNKIYVVNEGDKSFSVYDINGKLTKKSISYNDVHCLAAGYALVNMEIDGVNYDIVVDENGKELFKVESDQGDMSKSIGYDKKNNTLTIYYITGLDSGIDYTYSFKTQQVTKKTYDY